MPVSVLPFTTESVGSADYRCPSKAYDRCLIDIESVSIKNIPYDNLRKEQDNLIVSIADNGIGMDEETKKRIYERFYQADTSRTGAGNGLGLTLAKRIVDLHNGTIEVSSEVGKGTAFTVTLPEEG